MKPALIALCVFASIAGSTACGDDDDDSNNEVSTGLPEDKKLSDLDEDDAKQACEGVSKSFQSVASDAELERVACTLAAATLSVTLGSDDEPEGDVEKCETEAKRCIDGNSFEGDEADIDIGPGKEDCDDAKIDEVASNCDATVDEYESCVSDYLDAFQARLKSVSCDGVKDFEKFQSTLEEDIDVDDLEGCEDLRAKCPGLDLFDDTSIDVDDADQED